MKDTEKKGPGRPVKAKKASARCEFRVEPERKEQYEAQAEQQGLKLSAWLKDVADKAAGIAD